MGAGANTFRPGCRCGHPILQNNAQNVSGAVGERLGTPPGKGKTFEITREAWVNGGEIPKSLLEGTSRPQNPVNIAQKGCGSMAGG